MTTEDNKILRKPLEFQTVVETTASELLGRKIRLNYSAREQLRLLNLQVWSTRYGLSILEILQTLFKFYGIDKRTYHVSRQSLPVPLNMLCSIRSREHLEERVIRKNPDSEHEIAAAGLAVSRLLMGVGVPIQQDWVAEHAAAVHSQRHTVDEIRRELKSRRFRGNPFTILG